MSTTYFCCMDIATKGEHARPCGNELTHLLQKSDIFVKTVRQINNGHRKPRKCVFTSLKTEKIEKTYKFYN